MTALRHAAFAVGAGLFALATPTAAAADHAAPVALAPRKALDVLKLSFRDGELSTPDREALTTFGAHLGAIRSTTRKILIVAAAAKNDEDKALRRALEVRDGLARSSGVPLEAFILQVSATPAEFAGRVVVQPIRFARQAARPGRPSMLAPSDGGYVVVCRDGRTPPQNAGDTWPDDFAAARLNCREARNEAPETEPGSAGVQVGWDAAKGLWTLRCADGTPLLRRPSDPDDFHALRRCAR